MSLIFNMLSAIRRPVAASDLIYQPPAMTAPLVINNTTATSFPRSADVTAGLTVNNLHPQDSGRTYYRPDVDVVIKGINATSTIWIRGGRNIRVIGARYTAPPATPPVDQSGIIIESSFGHFFLEGYLAICNAQGVDAIVVRGVEAVNNAVGRTGGADCITVQSSYVANNYDTETAGGQHNDGVQIQNGGASSLKLFQMERVTIQGSQQGFQPSPNAGVAVTQGMYLRRVNVRRSPTPVGYTRSYYLADGNTSAMNTPNYPRFFDDVWGERNGSPDDTDQKVVYPLQSGGFSWAGRVSSDALSTYVHYVGSTITAQGIIRIGVPPGGDFIGPGNVGANYVSPWPTP